MNTHSLQSGCTQYQLGYQSGTKSSRILRVETTNVLLPGRCQMRRHLENRNVDGSPELRCSRSCSSAAIATAVPQAESCLLFRLCCISIVESERHRIGDCVSPVAEKFFSQFGKSLLTSQCSASSSGVPQQINCYDDEVGRLVTATRRLTVTTWCRRRMKFSHCRHDAPMGRLRRAFIGRRKCYDQSNPSLAVFNPIQFCCCCCWIYC